MGQYAGRKPVNKERLFRNSKNEVAESVKK